MSSQIASATRSVTLPGGGSFTGMATMLNVSMQGVVRSTSTQVLGAILALLALTSPVVAKYTPQIIAAMADPSIADMLTSGMSNPSWLEAYASWVKNLSQTGIFALIVIAAMNIHYHICGGNALIVLARNIGRGAYLLAQLLAFYITTLALLVISALIAWIATMVVFGSAPLLPVLETTLLWWLVAVLIISIMALVEAAAMKIGASLGAGICCYLTMTIGAMWDWGSAHTPFGLVNLMTQVAAGQPGTAMLQPVVSSIALAVLLSAVGLVVFDRKNLDD